MNQEQVRIVIGYNDYFGTDILADPEYAATKADSFGFKLSRNPIVVGIVNGKPFAGRLNKTGDARDAIRAQLNADRKSLREALKIKKERLHRV